WRCKARFANAWSRPASRMHSAAGLPATPRRATTCVMREPPSEPATGIGSRSRVRPVFVPSSILMPSYYQWARYVQRRAHTVVLGLVRITLTNEIKAQAILGRIECLQQPMSQRHPRPLLKSAFKNGELHAHAVVLARLSDAAEPTRTVAI